MIENTSPSFTSKLTASTARMPPKRIAMSSARNRLIRGRSAAHRHGGAWPRHPRLSWMLARETWMAGPSPAMTKETTARSSQPLRPRVRLLPAEAGAALQRVGLEPALHLDPAAIDAARFEQDHDHQHEAVQRRLQARHAADAPR